VTSTSTCTVCRRRPAPQPQVCEPCRSRVRDALAAIVDLHAIAYYELQPGSGTGTRGTERSLGVRLAALDFVAGNDVLPTLEEWEREIRRHYDLTPYGPASEDRVTQAHHAMPTAADIDLVRVALAGCCAFLKVWWPQVADTHPAARDLATEVLDGYHTAQAAARMLPRTTWAVECPTDTEDGRCAYLLRVTGQDVGHVVVCRRCGTHWDVERLLLVVASDAEADVWLPADGVERLAGIPERTLRRWAAQGRVQRAHGRYEFRSVQAAVARLA
jgi:hypothetical protein